MILPSLVVANAGKKGRGVYTTKDIDADVVIEIAPVLVLSKNDRKIIEETQLYHYIFEWGKSLKKAGLAFGYMSMYNHSYNANCEYEMDYDNDTMTVRTIRPIKKGEELYINYNAIPDDSTPVWFDHKIDKKDCKED